MRIPDANVTASGRKRHPSLQVTRNSRRQERNADTNDKHANGDEAFPTVGQPFGRQQLRIEKGVCRIPQRSPTPKPNSSLCSAHRFHRKNDSGKPSDDPGAPGGNKPKERNSGKDLSHGRNYVCYGSKASSSAEG